MSLLSLLLVSLLSLLWLSPASSASIEAEQIHLSLGLSQNDFWVNFVTFDRPIVSYVRYGLSASELSLSSNASISLFLDGGRQQKQRFMHEASMLKLKPASTYFYQVITSTPDAAPVLNFSTIPEAAGYTQPLRIAMYGDFGLLNDQSHDRLEAESLSGNLDLIIHAGDLSAHTSTEQQPLITFPSAPLTDEFRCFPLCTALTTCTTRMATAEISS